MRPILILFLLLAAIAQGYAGTGDSIQLSIWKPPSWFSADKQQDLDNIKNFKLSISDETRLTDATNRSQLLGAYYKYAIDKHAGLIPTIKYYLINIPPMSFDNFFSIMSGQTDDVKTRSSDFRYLDSPKVVTISGKKAFYANTFYKMKLESGDVIDMRSRFICVQLKRKYLYVLMVDSDAEDCGDIYREAMGKINIR